MAISGAGKVAVVTGASAGIGYSTAVGLAEAGFQLAVGARRKDGLVKLVEDIQRRTGVKPFAESLDVTDKESVDAFVKGVVSEYGKVNVLVNNAGNSNRTWR